MEISWSKIRPAQASAEVVVVPYFEGESPERGPLRELDRAMGGRIGDAVARGELTGRWSMREAEAVLWPAEGLAARRILLVAAGPRGEYTAERAREVAGVAARRTRRFESVAFAVRNDAHVQAAVEGFVVGLYEPDLYRSERSEPKLRSLEILSGGDPRRALAAGRVVAEATNLCRTLVNEPPNELTPSRLAERAREALEPLGVGVQVLKGRQLERFGGLLAVAKGSEEPPVFLSMSWDPPRARRGTVLGLVGKGITFDSGGLSLKPSDAMEWMKGDMAGGAAVVCAIKAIAELKVPLRVIGAVPATENMPSGKATRVGDVIRHYSGKTAEILNTDAEGRLVLADALAWVVSQGATHVVDAATLTGAIEIALGKVAFGVMGRPDAWVERVLRAARRAGERAWPLPLYPEYREQLRSEIADMKNVGGRAGGSITAAWFLANHLPDDVPWAHLDIAGVAWDDAKPYRAKGATGAAVRSLVRLAQDLAERA